MKNRVTCLLIISIVLTGTTLIFYSLKQKTTEKFLSRDEKNAIISDALVMKLPITKAVPVDDTKAIDDQVIQATRKGNYESAININTSGLKKFPQSFTLQFNLAWLLGDCSEITPSPLKEKMLDKSKQLFEKLMHEVSSIPKSELYDFKNEYFYRFGMYVDQYKLGASRVKDYWGTNEWESGRGFVGYYSQGVGASNYARKLIEQGNNKLAIDYAQRALVAWAQYFTYSNNNYNAYVHYALALGILGYNDEMMRALNRSAAIIKKDLSYFEFKDVIAFVEQHKKI